MKNLTFLGEILQIQTQTINCWPDLTRVKNFDPDPSLVQTVFMQNFSPLTLKLRDPLEVTIRPVYLKN